jgi:hypothetical protein
MLVLQKCSSVTWRSPVGRLVVLVAMLALVGPSTARGQAPTYTAAQLGCAIYRQSVQSQIHTVSGNRQSQETAGREALVILRAVALAKGAL